MLPLRLNPMLDLDRLAAAYRPTRRLVIEDFLDEASAAALLRWATTTEQWRHILNGGDTVFEIPRADYLAMPAEERDRLGQAVTTAARTGFQYRYDSIRVEDDAAARVKRATPLDAFAILMSAPETLALLGHVIGVPDLDFADAQATAYRPGDFLTGHDDNVVGKGRSAAYVLSLNPSWRPEWGGLLLFHDGSRVDGVVPGFNRLSLFGVPQTHSVSSVTPAAAVPRYSITGWLRVSTE
jgi:hypothetical protein